MEHILALLLMSIISAWVGFGFNRMQDPDMIFSWYKDWLEYLAGHKFKTLRFRIFLFKISWNGRMPIYLWFDLSKAKYMNFSTVPARKKSKFLYYFTKPIGRCIICNTTWIGMCLGFIFFRTNPRFVLDTLIVGVASAGIVVMIINKYHNLQNN
jgi:hypothetical protein